MKPDENSDGRKVKKIFLVLVYFGNDTTYWRHNREKGMDPGEI